MSNFLEGVCMSLNGTEPKKIVFLESSKFERNRSKPTFFVEIFCQKISSSSRNLRCMALSQVRIFQIFFKYIFLHPPTGAAPLDPAHFWIEDSSRNRVRTQLHFSKKPYQIFLTFFFLSKKKIIDGRLGIPYPHWGCAPGPRVP